MAPPPGAVFDDIDDEARTTRDSETDAKFMNEIEAQIHQARIAHEEYIQHLNEIDRLRLEQERLRSRRISSSQAVFSPLSLIPCAANPDSDPQNRTPKSASRDRTILPPVRTPRSARSCPTCGSSPCHISHRPREKFPNGFSAPQAIQNLSNHHNQSYSNTTFGSKPRFAPEPARLALERMHKSSLNQFT